MFRGNRVLLACIYWAFVLYVFVPLILMVVMGFKDSKFIGFPVRNWTLDWYKSVFADAEILSTFGYSVSIAVLATLLSLLMGTWIAVLLEGRKFWGRAAMFGLTMAGVAVNHLLGREIRSEAPVRYERQRPTDKPSRARKKALLQAAGYTREGADSSGG